MNPRTADPALQELRRDIDHINREILDLLQKRAEVVLKIAALKQNQGWSGRDLNREKDMLQALTMTPSGPFGSHQIRLVFKAIFRASLEIQDHREYQDDVD